MCIHILNVSSWLLSEIFQTYQCLNITAADSDLDPEDPELFGNPDSDPEIKPDPDPLRAKHQPKKKKLLLLKQCNGNIP